MDEVKVGDKVRSPLFYGVAEVAELGTNSRGTAIATVMLDPGVPQSSIAGTTYTTTVKNLRSPDLPGGDIEFTPNSRHPWLTPEIAVQLRDEPSIAPRIRCQLDQAFSEAALDPDEWASCIGEMGHARIAVLHQAAKAKGLLA